ncbi:MAG: MBL fold metallo-hydrolase [Myxococcota bacterium]
MSAQAHGRIAFAGEALAVERAALPEAHGAEGLRLPRCVPEPGDAARGAFSARGDALREDIALHAGPVPGRAERMPVASLLEGWRRGTTLVAPALAAVLRAHVSGEVPAAPDGAQSWEVAPGVRMRPYLTPTLPPATHTNTFLLGPEGGELVLVEPAPPGEEAAEDLARWARQHGRPKALALTHHHRDHVGAADRLRELLGVPLWAHEGTAERLSGRVRVDRTFDDGATWTLEGDDPARGAGPQTIECLFTPGHAPGHLCFRDVASGVTLVGDMVAGVGTILVEPRDGHMGRYLASLRRLRGLPLTRLLPAHGGVLAAPGAVLERYVDHRLAREAKVRAALGEAAAAGETPANASELVPRAYADTPKMFWPLAAMALEAHLLKLAEDGEAVRQGRGWRPV